MIPTDLISRYLDGELSEAEWLSLQQLLSTDDSKLDEFVHHAFVLHPLLRESFVEYSYGHDLAFLQEEINPTPDPQSDDPGNPRNEDVCSVNAPSWTAGRSKNRSFLLTLAVALFIALTTWSIGLFLPSRQIGVVTACKNCVWTSDPSKSPSDEITADELISIEEGIVEVQFSNGVSLALHGPAEVQLRSTNHCELISGKIAARAVMGYTVGSNGIQFVDRGTEFVVVADEQGNTALDVLGGIVEVELPDGSFNHHTLRVVEGRAFRFDSNSGELQEVMHEPQNLDLLPTEMN